MPQNQVGRETNRFVAAGLVPSWEATASPAGHKGPDYAFMFRATEILGTARRLAVP
jgi:hypothetical protein